MSTVHLISNFDDALALLTKLAEAPLEIRHRFIDLVESGEQVFTIKTDDLAASSASELVVRLDPTNCLGGLVAAFGTGNGDAAIFEHGDASA
jgi:hypothetical protein